MKLSLLAPLLRALPRRCRARPDHYLLPSLTLSKQTRPLLIHTLPVINRHGLLLLLYHLAWIRLSNQAHITREHLLEWQRVESTRFIEPSRKRLLQFNLLPFFSFLSRNRDRQIINRYMFLRLRRNADSGATGATTNVDGSCFNVEDPECENSI